MKNESDTPKRFSPKFSKTAREWILASALYDGIEDEDIRQIEMLLSERGASPNVLLPEYGITPFHMVVANESSRFAVKATDLCLQHGADPNVRSEDGLTPVHLAAMWGCAEVLHVLLASGGDPWLVDSLNLNAFDYALREKQNTCYKILKTYCNSQPKPSGCTKSPYQLNLKRVILYKNDLKIVYEASPSNSPRTQRSASTQTSPTVRNQITLEDKMKRLLEKSDIYSKEHKDKEVLNINQKNKDCKYFENDSQVPVSPRLKDIINKHRGNSMVFEYSPSKKEDSLSSEVDSWKDADSSNEVVRTAFSELVKKLDQSNVIRQSLKTSEYSNEMLKNVTQRKKPLSSPKPTISGVFDKSTFPDKYKVPQNTIGRVSNGSEENPMFSDKSCQYEDTTHETGFILNDSKAISMFSNKSVQHDYLKNGIDSELNDSKANSIFPDKSCQYDDLKNRIGIVLNDSESHLNGIDDFNPTLNVESPPSIGFILDNIDNSCDVTRSSSLFSDIASDIEAFSTPGQNINIDNIMTEDEKSLVEENATKNTSRDSLYPYVSCENTREKESIDDFASCERLQSSGVRNTLTEESDKTADFILSDKCEKSRTSVNPEVITSTPDRSAAGSDEVSFASALDNENQQSVRSESEKRSWVEAKIVSSSDEEPYISISEEYEYTDIDEGVVLIEKRYFPKDISESTSRDEKKDMRGKSSSSECESVSTVSGSEGAYDTDELRRALRQHGVSPGPITGNTKRVYLRKLKRCRRKSQPPPPSDGEPAYSPELVKTLSMSCEHLLAEWAHLEDSMSASFTCARRPWREGQAKTSFTYLLLDPRLAHNLPAHSQLPHTRLWPDFLRAIFYVGKGKRSRPYAHLYKAVSIWQQQGQSSVNCRKIQRILDIWRSGAGVICLHVFLNVIPVEAFTREAAMISALTLPQLTNEKAGEFYGSAASWSLRLKRRLGCVLLHRAFKVFLAEGERQLRPADID